MSISLRSFLTRVVFIAADARPGAAQSLHSWSGFKLEHYPTPSEPRAIRGARETAV
jgi:hypothetical protein